MVRQHRSLYTLFQIMTLESRSMGIARPVMEHFPYAWIFFVWFILVATFTMLNVFIAIIVNAMQNYSDEERWAAPQASDRVRAHIEGEMHTEFRAMREEVRKLREEIGTLRRESATAAKVTNT